MGSWKAPNNSNLWLRDWLPNDVSNVRVVLYGYNTDVQTRIAHDSIEDLSGRLLESLASFRRDTDVCGPSAAYDTVPISFRIRLDSVL